MYPKLLHLYGPLSINSYGLMIAIGLLTFLYLASRHPRRKKLMSVDAFYEAAFVGLALGVVGGRILFAIMEPQAYSVWYEVFYPWEGGFSLLAPSLPCSAGCRYTLGIRA